MAAAAAEHGITLATRDRRAAEIYRALEIGFEPIAWHVSSAISRADPLCFPPDSREYPVIRLAASLRCQGRQGHPWRQPIQCTLHLVLPLTGAHRAAWHMPAHPLAERHGELPVPSGKQRVEPAALA